jgi:NADH-quinone oxidoreductase subunit H
MEFLGAPFGVALTLCLFMLLGFVAVWPMFAIWLERKAAADFQSRLGPMYVGGFHGWAQSLADGLKLAFKEDIIPGAADRLLFWISPAVAFCGAFAAFVALPIAPGWQIVDLDNGIFFITSVVTLGVVMAGWASNNKWSLYGALREAAQLVSYEIPIGVSLLVPLLIVGSLRLGDIVGFQAAPSSDDPGLIYLTGNGWLLFYSPWTFMAGIIYFIAALAECKRAPFDLPEAESELVSGFHTEMSGLRFSFFFLEEYAMMFMVSAIGVLVFLGGWQPLPFPLSYVCINFEMLGWFGKMIASGIFLAKSCFLVWVMIWIRWTVPRLRVDQVMIMGYKYLTPMAFVALVLTALYQYYDYRLIPGLF